MSDTPSSAAAITTLPIGTILPCFLGPKSQLPSGWLLCDGKPIPGEYQDLMTLLGRENTPNLIGRTLIGAGDLDAADKVQTDMRSPDFDVLGSALQSGNTGGKCQHILETSEIPRHSHTINGGDFGKHWRSFEGSEEGRSKKPYETSPTDKLNGTDEAGGGKGHYNVQPYYAVAYMICARK